MRWTSQDECGMIKEWAKECGTEELTEQYHFSMPAVSTESYWCKHDEAKEIMEYTFDTVPELKAMLERELTDEFYRELLLPLAIAAFKEKKIIQIDTEIHKKDGADESSASGKDKFTIPEFVYVF